MRLPSRRRELVRDQPVGGLVIRDAQQRFRQAHQDHAFLRRQVVLPEECVEPALARAIAPHGIDELDRELLDLCPHFRIELGERQQAGDAFALLGEVQAVNRRPNR